MRSWLLELLERVFAEDQSLEHVRGYVEDSGERRWIVERPSRSTCRAGYYAVVAGALRSRQEDSYSAKVMAELRKFGGIDEEGSAVSIGSQMKIP